MSRRRKRLRLFCSGTSGTNVRRGGQVGKVAPRLQTPVTRRQLLEYRVAFDIDEVLLVDAKTKHNTKSCSQ
jgi:hypothetical protein